jgi:hypothetical protein
MINHVNYCINLVFIILKSLIKSCPQFSSFDIIKTFIDIVSVVNIDIKSLRLMTILSIKINNLIQ